MKKNNILVKFVVAAVAAAALSTSCSIEPEFYSQLAPNNFYSNATSVYERAYRPYQNFRSYAWQFDGTWGLEEFGTDELCLPEGASYLKYGGQYSQIHRHQFSSSMLCIKNAWNGIGNGVAQCWAAPKELEALDYLVGVAQLRSQRRIIGDPGEHNHGLGVIVASVGIGLENGHGGLIFLRSEKQRLIGAQAHFLPPSLPILRIEFMRAFCYYHHVCIRHPGRQVPQAAERQQAVLEIRAVPVHQNDIEGGMKLLILEGIVEHYDIDAVLHQPGASFHPVLIHRNSHGGELALDLQGLISRKSGGAVRLHYLEPLALAFVAAGEHRQIGIPPTVAVLQEAEYHLRMRGFAGATDGDVSHADGGHFGSGGLPPGLGGALKNQALYQHIARKYNQESRKVRQNPGS